MRAEDRRVAAFHKKQAKKTKKAARKAKAAMSWVRALQAAMKKKVAMEAKALDEAMADILILFPVFCDL